MSGVDCDPDSLRAAAAVLGDVGERVRALPVGGAAGDMAVWGVLGRVTGASAQYESLAVAVEGHLAAAAEFCDRAEVALRRVADEYEVADQRSADGFPGGCDER